MNDELQTRITERVSKLTSEFQQKETDKAEKVKQEFDDMNTDEPSGPETAFKINVDVEWRDTSIKFDVPKIYKKYEDLTFAVPELHTELETITFKVPTMEWSVEVVGYYIKCHKLKCRKEPITTKVPVPGFKDVTIKLDIPKIRSKSITIKTYVPAVEMSRTELKFKYPKFKIKSIETEIKEKEATATAKASEVESEFQKDGILFRETLQQAVIDEVQDFYKEEIDLIVSENKKVMEAYAQKIDEYKQAIKRAKENNAIDIASQLENELSTIVAEAELTNKKLQEQLNKLTAEQEMYIRAIAEEFNKSNEA